MKTKKIRFYIGLDVHKKSTTYVVRDINGNIVLDGKCASQGKELHEILGPYLFSCIIGLETNTEIYPIYDYFKKEKYDIRAGNTIQLRTLIGKNDHLDAKRISDMLRLNTFPCAFIPEGAVKELRGLVKIRHNTSCEVRRIQSQIQAQTRRYGLVMPSGETFTKRWIKALQEHIVLSHGGIELKHMFDLYKFVNSKLEDLTVQMTVYAKGKFPKEYEAISAIKGIGDILTPYFISEICPITRFASVKKLRRYAGVIPCSNESAEKTYSSFLPKATSRGILRWALVEAAHCMTMHNDRIKAYYKKKKKQKKITGKAIMAVASSVSDIIFKTLMSIQA
jgi:transposase